MLRALRMKLSDFDFELPAELIAQEAVEPRDAARLLVHELASARTTHARVRELERFLAPGDLLVVNDTRVRPARLCGRRASGGAVELLVLGPAPVAGLWRAWVRPAKRLKPGEELELEGGALRARAVERPRGEGGELAQEWWVAIDDPAQPTRALEELLEQRGRMPLPPYIERAPESDPARDRERYQTVYARTSGAIAAPTAGLHFTPELLARLAARGVERASVTLHVGLGTFQPVAVDDLAQHVMHSEDYVLPSETVDAVARARARGGRVVAVGTTSLRVLESCARDAGGLAPGSGSTRLFVTPGFDFRVVDALLTNFHLPRSTLVMLVAAFVGLERQRALYAAAIAERYRFFSYGDAQLLIRGP